MARILGNIRMTPQPDFDAKRDDYGYWTATQSFVSRKGTFDASRMGIGKARLRDMDPHCEPSVAMIRLTGVESVKTIPGGFIRITCKFGSPTIFGTTNTTGNETNPTTAADNPFTDATSTANSDASSDSAKYDPRKKKAITAPTYSMRGTLEELPIANHPKFKLLSFQEQAILGQLMSGELTISDDWTQVGRKERINVSFGNPYDKWIPLATSDGPVTLSTECLKFARRIAVGKTTYKSPSWLWVRKWEDSAGMTGDQLNAIGKIVATPTGTPPTAQGRNWMIISGDQEQSGPVDSPKYTCEVSYLMSPAGGFDSFIYYGSDS